MEPRRALANSSAFFARLSARLMLFSKSLLFETDEAKIISRSQRGQFGTPIDSTSAAETLAGTSQTAHTNVFMQNTPSRGPTKSVGCGSRSASRALQDAESVASSTEFTPSMTTTVNQFMLDRPLKN